MAALGPSGNMNLSNSNISVSIVNGNTSVTGSRSGAGGLTERDARDIASMVQGMVDDRIVKQTRPGGIFWKAAVG